MKIYTLKWGLQRRRFAIYANLAALVRHFNENIRNHPEHRRWKNAILSVRGATPEDVKLSAEQVQLLMQHGLLKQAESEAA